MTEKNAGSGRTMTVLERVQRLEEVLPQLDQSLRGTFERNASQARGALQNVVEVLNAVIRLQGEGFEQRVEEEVQAARTRRAQVQLEKAKEILKTLVDQNVLVASESITEDSVLVGKELDPQGNVVGLGEAQAEFNQFNATAREALLGKGVGAKYEGPDGQFEVTAIYKPNPEKAPEKPAETALVQ